MKKQYIYPQNMRASATLWLWSLKDFVVVIIGALFSAIVLATTKLMIPAVLVGTYALLSIRADGTTMLASYNDTVKSIAKLEEKLNISKDFRLFNGNQFVGWKSYPNCETYALKNVNIKINGGEHYAIVGKNGSGKTTFIKLLCRLYDVSKGAILINGINIKEYTKDSIIRLYSVVFQDYKIFSLTAAQNIAASDDYDKAKLYDSFEKADIKERILKMANKENTYLYKDLDENGVEISGGEAQKLALTRALYKDAPIVILDEPTASMDPISESSMYSRFNSFVENKTTIYISHRLSSCAFCDNIAVFDKAELVEVGTHQNLIKLNGKYAELWSAQAEYYLN